MKQSNVVPNNATAEQDARYFNSTRPPMAFGDHDFDDQILQSEQIHALPSFFVFDTQLQDLSGQGSEWGRVHSTSARTNHQTRHGPISIYGTSSEYTIPEDLSYEPALPSPISSLGSHDIPTPFSSSAMIWERVPTITDNPTNTFPQVYTIKPQESYQDHVDDDMDLLNKEEMTAKLEYDPISISPSSSFVPITGDAGNVVETPISSKHLNVSDLPPAKRPRASSPAPRWSTTRKMRKRKLPSSNHTFSQSPSTSPTSSTKTNHNAVEKQYRNRLNDKFEALLSVLPEQEKDAGSTAGKVSKGDVLVWAKDYIESLELSRDGLREDIINLEGGVQVLRSPWQ